MILLQSLRAAAASFAAVCVSSAALAAPFDNVFIFGDSLVDSGNIAIATGGAVPSPSLGYFQGRFNDGPSVGDWLTFYTTGTPLAAPSLAGGNNYSFGNARIVANADTVPDLQLQVGAFALDSKPVDGDDLFVINMGGNDVFALVSGDIGGLSADDYIASAATIVADSIVQLELLGAQNLLLMGVPDVGAPPASTAGGTSAEARAFSETLQQAILDELAMRSFSLDLRLFDWISFSDTLLSAPDAFGLPPLESFNLLEPCIGFSGEFGAPDVDCSGFASFDTVHPTSPVNEAFALAALEETFGVRIAEPASLALLGFGLLAGAHLRRRA